MREIYGKGTGRGRLPADRRPRGEWGALPSAPTIPVLELVPAPAPNEPNVYLWRHDGLAVFVGIATSLRGCAWSKHLGAGVSLSGSSLRRNVCQLLFGIPLNFTGRPTKQKVTTEQAAAIRDWLLACELSWQPRAAVACHPEQAPVEETTFFSSPARCWIDPRLSTSGMSSYEHLEQAPYHSTSLESLSDAEASHLVQFQLSLIDGEWLLRLRDGFSTWWVEWPFSDHVEMPTLAEMQSVLGTRGLVFSDTDWSPWSGVAPDRYRSGEFR